jgi:hypothetical protein
MATRGSSSEAAKGVNVDNWVPASKDKNGIRLMVQKANIGKARNIPVATVIASVIAELIRNASMNPQDGSILSIMALADPTKRTAKLIAFMARLVGYVYRVMMFRL